MIYAKEIIMKIIRLEIIRVSRKGVLLLDERNGYG